MWSTRTVLAVLLNLLVFQAFLSWCNARLVWDENEIVPRMSIETNDIPRTFAGSQGIEEKYFGLYTQGLVHEDDFEMVVPVRVTKDGSFVSHDLGANHDGIEQLSRRRRRSIGEDVPDFEDVEELVHYNLTLGGRALKLNLRPSHQFIGGALIVERHGPEGFTRERPKKDVSSCHFQGSIDGQPKSSVAISACHGLAGMLRTEHGEYWMEPSFQHTPTTSGVQHPHLIYKRSALQPPPQRGRGKGKGKGRGKGKGNRKAKIRYNKNGVHKKRRGRRGKNCATKEPPRVVFAKMEHIHEEKFNEIKRGYQNSTMRRGQGERRGRQPRSISRPSHVEVLLVADSTMAEFHQKGNVETYLLTIMNMVSTLYLDPTIGNFVNVVVVKIILLDEQHAGNRLNITTNADTTLTNFCKWQRELNPSNDTHPNHHDVAILITRKDICARQNIPCSTLGVAHVGGMCQPDRSCSVNEDNGITLAHTITHELGHNFGMYHDTEKIGCHRRVGSTLHVMTPVFEADTVEVAWSHCSKRDLTTFLDSGMGECLSDIPAQGDYIYPELPLGALYDTERQCRFQFGENVENVCTNLSEICQNLWCMVNGTCMTMLRPAAPGTSCGVDMWCENLNCVPRSPPPPPQDGDWGDWSDWSECSRTCGAGISMRIRQCDTPLPKHGGKFCTGERTRYEVCNTDPCPPNEPTFRQYQCSKFDNYSYEDKLIPKWKEYFDPDIPCELYCSSMDETIILPLGPFASDGTPCKEDTNDMCISGICKKVGCDWVVDSNSTLDDCGICNGTGTNCKRVHGIYNKPITKMSGFSEVAVIPAGSRNIQIEEAANSKNFIGIFSIKSKQFYKNDKNSVMRKKSMTQYLVAGTSAIYERDRDWEKVKIPGPIQEDILIYQMIYKGKHHNPGVKYQYTVDNPNRKPQISYKWSTAKSLPCNRTCGRGFMRQIYVCINNTGDEVDEDYCTNNNEIEKPMESLQICNAQPCPTFWWIGPWTQCPHCKQYNTVSQKRRKVYCKDIKDHKFLAEHECDIKNKPTTTTPCLDLPNCNYRYP